MMRDETLPSREILRRYYETLLQRLGPQGWWPARTRLEVILGAILTQNTSWRNVELAMKRLRQSGLLKWTNLRSVPRAELEAGIRPAGFYRQKAHAIHNFVRWLEGEHRGSLDHLFSQAPEEARRQLLELKGLGPETVDAILLYAGKIPVFVADAYTRRILSRHGLISEKTGYFEAQQFIHGNLNPDAAVYGEFHALLVETGKVFCRLRDPDCDRCPLGAYLPQKIARRQYGVEMDDPSDVPGGSIPQRAT